MIPRGGGTLRRPFCGGVGLQPGSCALAAALDLELSLFSSMVGISAREPTTALGHQGPAHASGCLSEGVYLSASLGSYGCMLAGGVVLPQACQ